ncbi:MULTISPECIES: PEP-CTERM sorting domain-containing protein [Silvimonas]|uniref:PEP-CTERM sorting domain-containing protein n=1 Tax=Silvimonas TaxID=300264 RepID=UPI0024B339D7|nr:MULTISPECIES: PEP-CTERM sorting domain-containing protein [Silvimonas]MDR3427533.1 PEP-CTERM sorting domain-containing protein [Silvimonas sp.]
MRFSSIRSLPAHAAMIIALASPNVLAWDWDSWEANGYDTSWHPLIYGTGFFFSDDSLSPPQPTANGYMMTTGELFPGYVTLDQVFSDPERIDFSWSYVNGNTLRLEDVWFGYMLNGVATPLYHTLADPAVTTGASSAFIGAGQDFAFYMYMPNGEQPNEFGVTGLDTINMTATITPVPEPGTDLLLLVGLGLSARVARRYRGSRPNIVRPA